MYLAQRAGHRLEGHGAKGSPVFGGAMPRVGRIFGNGDQSLKDMHKALMPGEHLVPHSHIMTAVHHYKTQHGLHHHRGGAFLPPHHVVNLLHRYAGGAKVRGGFAWAAALPLLSGVAMPFIGEALKGLMGGFANKSGQHVSNALFGAGVPIPVHGHHERVYKIHGGSFKSLVSRALGHLGRIFKSEPARKLGSHAFGALKEAFMNAISGGLDSAASRFAKRFEPTPTADTPISESTVKRIMDQKRLDGHEEPEKKFSVGRDAGGQIVVKRRIAPQSLDHEDVAERLVGSGIHKRRRHHTRKYRLPVY